MLEVVRRGRWIAGGAGFRALRCLKRQNRPRNLGEDWRF